MSKKIDELKSIAKELRRNIMKMAYCAGGTHLAPSFSCIDILTVLYFGDILKINPLLPEDMERDRFILSKGHASAAIFATLAKKGLFNEELLYQYTQAGSLLGGHPKIKEIPGIEASTGALGHGLSFAQGIAYCGKKDKKDYNVYVLLGDGECQEGSIWEGALFAPQMKLDNLFVIVDYNKLQAMDHLDSIIGMEPFKDKWKAFGWNVIEVDGHDYEELVNVLEQRRIYEDIPNLIIAHTVKGKGVSFMENVPIWHYRLPNEEEMKIVIKELEFDSLEWLYK